MPYPVHVKQATASVSGIQTTISIHTFTDKILITITQEGKLAQWVQVPISPSNHAHGETYLPSSGEDDLLPLPHLTAQTLLGASTPERESIGQLFAVQIASAIATRDPNETRAVLVGLGLVNPTQLTREGFFDMMELIASCL